MRWLVLGILIVAGCSKPSEPAIWAHLADGQEVVISDASIGEEGIPASVLGQVDPAKVAFEEIEQATRGRVVSDVRKASVRLVPVRIMDGKHSGRVLWIQRSCITPRP